MLTPNGGDKAVCMLQESYILTRHNAGVSQLMFEGGGSDCHNIFSQAQVTTAW